MNLENPVWLFIGEGGVFPGGVFDNFDLAKEWIKKNRLSGVLTAYPLNEGSFDWALRFDCVGMRKEKMEAKKLDPKFIGSFSSASQPHFHFTDGVAEGLLGQPPGKTA
jgi:hypothetical protein